MFGIGFTELLVVLVVALLVIGPEKLPEVARTLAKAFNEFKRTTHDIKRSVGGIDLLGTNGHPPPREHEAEGPSTTPPKKKAAPPKKRAASPKRRPGKTKGADVKKTRTAKGRKAGPAG